MSSSFINSQAVLKAINKATDDWGFCRNRVWAIAKSLPGGPDQFQNLLPSDASHVPERNGESHQLCTFDFCEQSRVNFTLVKQRHESGCNGGQCKIEEFSPKLLAQAIERGKPTAWSFTESGKGQGRILEINERYMAISHVWSDGTGAGNQARGEVNTCLFQFFSGFARQLHCDGLWWDAICIPTRKDLREKALKKMQQNYKTAAVTLVHDSFLRSCEWVTADLACFHIMMSPWFSRGWTALELKMSQNVEIIFKGPSGLITKNLDRDILGGGGTLSIAPEYQLAREMLTRLRQDKVSQVNDLVAILGSRYTSWPRDMAIISGLMIGIDMPDTSTEQKIYQEILQEFGEVSHAHLFHNSATMPNGYNWCPTNLYDLLVNSSKDTLQVEENGNLFGKWLIMSIDHLNDERFISGQIHPLIAAKVELARQDKDQHMLLIEPAPRSGDLWISRGLLVTPLLKYNRASRGIDCYCDYVGPVYFHPPFLRSEIENNYGAFLFENVHIGYHEKIHKQGHGKRKLHEDVQRMIKRMRSGSANTKPTKREKSSLDSVLLAFSEGEVQEEFRKAVIAGELNAVQYLLRSRPAASLDTPDIVGWSALHHATWNGHTEVAKLLVRQLEAPGLSGKGQEPIHLAAERGNKQIMEILLESSTPDLKTKDGLTALHLAAKYRHIKAVNILLASKWKIDATNMIGQTALHMTSLLGYEDVVQTLCDLKADYTLRDNQQKTALHLAALKGHKKTADLLVKAGAVLDDRDESFFTPLHLAVMREEKGAIEVLVHIGADMEARSKTGRTPLHIAAVKNLPAIIETLVGLGANLEAQEDDGSTPLHEAAWGRNYIAIETLVNLGANLEARSEIGQTPLHVAARAIHLDGIETLVRLGADLEAKDNFQETPLDMIMRQGAANVTETIQYFKNLKSQNAKRKQM